MGNPIITKPVVAGDVEGEVLASLEPLSFWGGFDAKTGEIIDRRHPLSGQNAMGRVLAIPFSRGSSTATPILLEAIRVGSAPIAILTIGIDSFFALAAIIAKELYKKKLPVYALEQQDFGTLYSGEYLKIMSDGIIYRYSHQKDPGLILTDESF